MMKRFFCLVTVLMLAAGCALAQETGLPVFQRQPWEQDLWTDAEKGVPPAGMIVLWQGEAAQCRVVNAPEEMTRVMDGLKQMTVGEPAYLAVADDGLVLTFITQSGVQIVYRFEGDAYVTESGRYQTENGQAFWQAINVLKP